MAAAFQRPVELRPGSCSVRHHDEAGKFLPRQQTKRSWSWRQAHARL